MFCHGQGLASQLVEQAVTLPLSLSHGLAAMLFEQVGMNLPYFT